MDKNNDTELFIKNRNKEKYLPSLSNSLFLQKIVSLESLFKIPGVDSISISTEYSFYNAGDSYHYMPHITIDNTYDISNNIDSKSQYLIDLKNIDDEIISYICEDSVDLTSEDELERHISYLNEILMNDLIIKKEDRLSTYLDIGKQHFDDDIIPFFENFLESLEKKEYFSKKEVIYGVEFDFFPLTTKSFEQTYNVREAVKHNLFDYSINKIFGIILESTLENSNKLINFQFSYSELDPVLIQKYDNSKEYEKDIQNYYDKKVHLIDTLDFSKPINTQKHLNIIIDKLQNIIQPIPYNTYFEKKEELNKMYYAKFENKILSLNLKKEKIEHNQNKRL